MQGDTPGFSHFLIAKQGNTPPTAGDDGDGDPAFTTNGNTPFTTGNVLENDSDFNGDGLTITDYDTTSSEGETV